MEAFRQESSVQQVLGGERSDQDSDGSVDLIKKLVRTGNASSLDDEIRKWRVNLNNSGSPYSRNNALHLACERDNLEKVIVLVRNGADVNCTGDDDATPLHFCVRNQLAKKLDSPPGSDSEGRARKTKRHDKYETVVHYLMEHHAEINARDSFGRTPLHMAALLDNEVIASELIMRAGKALEIDAESDLGETPMHLACRAAHWRVVSRLVESGASFSAADSRGQNCFHKAASVLSGGADPAAAVRRLVQDFERIYLRDTDALIRRDAEGTTPLDVAVARGNIAVAKVFIEAGAEVDAGALIAACGIRRPDLVEMLLKRGVEANPSPKSNRKAPLIATAERGDASTISVLLDFGADVEARDASAGGRGRTPLLSAIAAGEAEAAKTLLEAGANLLATDAEGRSGLVLAALRGDLGMATILLERAECAELLSLTDVEGKNALHFATADNGADMAQFLIENGIDIEAKTSIREETPLHLAAAKDEIRMMKLIVGKNPKTIAATDSRGNTALHIACRNNSVRAAGLLLKSGSPKNHPNESNGKTPISVAVAHSAFDCVRLLVEEHGADPGVADFAGESALSLAADHHDAESLRIVVENYTSPRRGDSSELTRALERAIVTRNKKSVRIILDSSHWVSALLLNGSDGGTLSGGRLKSPLRDLIENMPEEAAHVLAKCINGSDDASTDGDDFEVRIDYIFLHDSYKISEDKKWRDGKISDSNINLMEKSIWDNPEDMHSRLSSSAATCHTSSEEYKDDHILMMMVEHQRTELLNHPLCLSLIRRKWIQFGGVIYFLYLLLYTLFVASLTLFVITTPAAFSTDQLEFYAEKKDANASAAIKKFVERLGSEDIEIMCLNLEADTGIIRSKAAFIAQIGLIIVLALLFIKGAIDLVVHRIYRHLLDHPDYALELSCYVTAALCAIDLSSCHSRTGIRSGWQWQLAAYAVTSAWINLLYRIRQIPFLGIYVLMVIDVLYTFLKFAVIILLFVIAFSLGFHCLLAQQPAFSHAGFTGVKTLVMMLGEIDFADVFANNVSYSGIERTAHLPYPTFTLLLFILFVFAMSIVVVNLLVGLAVDDIKEIADNAALVRLAMQIRFILDIEAVMPMWLKRRLITRGEIIYPNRKRSLFLRLFFDDHLMNSIMKSLARNFSSSSRRANKVDPVLDGLTKLREEVQDTESAIFKRLDKLDADVRVFLKDK